MKFFIIYVSKVTALEFHSSQTDAKKVTFRSELSQIMLNGIQDKDSSKDKSKKHIVPLKLKFFAVFKFILELFLKRYFDDEAIEKIIETATKSSTRSNLEGILTFISYDTAMFKDSISFNSKKKIIKMLYKVSTPYLWIYTPQWNVKKIYIYVPNFFFKNMLSILSGSRNPKRDSWIKRIFS